MTAAHSKGQHVVATSSSVTESVEILNTAKNVNSFQLPKLLTLIDNLNLARRPLRLLAINPCLFYTTSNTVLLLTCTH